MTDMTRPCGCRQHFAANRDGRVMTTPLLLEPGNPDRGGWLAHWEATTMGRVMRQETKSCNVL